MRNKRFYEKLDREIRHAIDPDLFDLATAYAEARHYVEQDTDYFAVKVGDFEIKRCKK